MAPVPAPARPPPAAYALALAATMLLSCHRDAAPPAPAAAAPDAPGGPKDAPLTTPAPAPHAPSEPDAPTAPDAPARAAATAGPAGTVRCHLARGPNDTVRIVVENAGSTPALVPDPDDPGAVTLHAGDRVVSAARPGRPVRTRTLPPGGRLEAPLATPLAASGAPLRAALAAPGAVSLDCHPAPSGP